MPNAARNELTWRIESSARVGCERYRFNGHVVSLLAEQDATGGKMNISIESDGAFSLTVEHFGKKEIVRVHKGTNNVVVP